MPLFRHLRVPIVYQSWVRFVCFRSMLVWLYYMVNSMLSVCSPPSHVPPSLPATAPPTAGTRPPRRPGNGQSDWGSAGNNKNSGGNGKSTGHMINGSYHRYDIFVDSTTDLFWRFCHEIQQMAFSLLAALYCRWSAVQQSNAKTLSVGFQNRIFLWREAQSRNIGVIYKVRNSQVFFRFFHF